jgi:transcriptional regulator with XRE-family HTH domain
MEKIMTKLGLFIKQRLLERDGSISQKKLASEIGYSASQLSNLLTGKAAFDMELLIKCQKYFALDDRKTIELFESAFSSFDKIIIEPKYLNEERTEMLKGVLITFLLYRYPKMYDTEYNSIRDAAKLIKDTLTAKSDVVEVPRSCG